VNSADALLIQLAAADEAVRPRHPFLFAKTGGMKQSVAHPGFPEVEIACQEPDILELQDAGYIRVDPTATRATLFYVTREGLGRAAQLERAHTASTGGSTDAQALDWDSRVLPVLEAVARAYSRAPSDLGVSLEGVAEELGYKTDTYNLSLVLDELVRAGYLEETMGVEQLPGPAWCRLREKGLQVTAGWPSASGETAFERLLAIVDERIRSADSDEERSKWERLRDGVAGVGRDVLVGVLTTAANAAAKGL